MEGIEFKEYAYQKNFNTLSKLGTTFQTILKISKLPIATLTPHSAIIDVAFVVCAAIEAVIIAPISADTRRVFRFFAFPNELCISYKLIYTAFRNGKEKNMVIKVVKEGSQTMIQLSPRWWLCMLDVTLSKYEER
jgi:hypothetical protein